MAKIRIVLADTDEKYLMPLEKRFIEGFGDRGELHIITDKSYVQTFFSEPQTLDILIINENLYEEEYEKHNIANIFLLIEQVTKEDAGSLNSNRIYKYTSVKDIYHHVVNNVTGTLLDDIRKSGDTKCIFVYSPIGGAGTTTISAGICSVLAQSNQRVLYIGMDTLQSFGWIMEKPATLPAEIEKKLLSQSSFVYHLVKPYIVEQQFYLIPPFSRMLSALNIQETSFCELIESIRVTNDFDYIVIDGDGNFTETVSKLMGQVHHIVIVARQDKISAHKLECLLKNIDCSDSNRFCFICNGYLENKENALTEIEGGGQCKISEYIAQQETIDMMKIKNVSQIRGIQKIAFMFM